MCLKLQFSSWSLENIFGTGMGGSLRSLCKPKGKCEEKEVSETGKSLLEEKWAFTREGLYSLAFCLLPYIKNHVPSRCFWGCTEDLLSEMWLQRVADRVIAQMSSGLLTYVLPHHAGSCNIFIFICILVIQFFNKNTTVKRKIWKLFLRFIFCNFWTH